MRPNETIVILNAQSGRKRHSERTDAVEAAARAMEGLDIAVVDRPRDLQTAAREALEKGYRTVIAAGGDGTICAVAGVLAGSGRTMGIVPLGTFNFLARSLDLPEDPVAALHVAASGRKVQVTVGEVNGKVFLNNASLGAYAAVLDIREGIYRRWGRSRLAAYWSVVVALSTIYRPLKMRITVDGTLHRRRSPMAFVAIRAFQLEEYGFDGVEAVRGGQFALLLPPDSGRLMLIWRALKIVLFGLRRGHDYTLLTGSDIVIETRRTHRLVARDGERETMRGPYHFRVLTDALTVRVPPE